MKRFMLSLLAVATLQIPLHCLQAGILISGQDFRGTTGADTHSLKAFDTANGDLLWKVEAGTVKGSDIDPLTGDLVVADGGPTLTAPGAPQNITRYNPQTGEVVGTPFSHDIGFATGLAVHPVSGDIYLSAGSSPPGHHGVRRFDANGGNQQDFSGLVGLASGFSPVWHTSPTEHRLFVMTTSQRRPKAFLVNGANDGMVLSGQFVAGGTSGSSEQMTINQNNNKLYATHVQDSIVYEWDPQNSTMAPVVVLTDTTNLQGASGLTFDENNNMYVAENGSASGKVHIYKYTPSGSTWGNGTVFATIEPSLGWNNPGTFLEYVKSPDPPPTDFEWGLNDLGSWTNSSSWNAVISPNSSEHTVTFGSAATSTTTAVLNTAVLVNRITFDNANQYIVAGGGNVQLAATTIMPVNDPVIDVILGDHQFQAAVQLLSDATVNVGSGSTLSFNNDLNLAGRVLTKMGDGTLSIRNDLVTSGGHLTIAQGTVTGNGTVGGDLSNTGGTVAPGNRMGLLVDDQLKPGTLTAASSRQVPEPTAWVLWILGLAFVSTARFGRNPMVRKYSLSLSTR